MNNDNTEKEATLFTYVFLTHFTSSQLLRLRTNSSCWLNNELRRMRNVAAVA